MVHTAERKGKIGLLGGTFDPVHQGHLAVAKHVHRALGLDSILFIPASFPPHKTGHADGLDISSFEHRFAMLERATADFGPFTVSNIEAQRSAPSYSIDTINILLSEMEASGELFFVIGVDAFLEIDTWKRFKELPDHVNFVVISRPNYSPDKVGEVILQNFAGYAFDPIRQIWSSPDSKGTFYFQHMEPVPISSTDVREKVRNGEDITGLVHPAVAEYIKKHLLYS